MSKFSTLSATRLATCHPEIQRLFNEVIKFIDCTIIEGHRNQEAQTADFNAGRTKLPWPLGKHNQTPSLAVDVVPYPVNWNDTGRIYMFVGYVRATADRLGIPIRCGADWDSDWDTKDQEFNDLPHFELK